MIGCNENVTAEGSANRFECTCEADAAIVG